MYLLNFIKISLFVARGVADGGGRGVLTPPPLFKTGGLNPRTFYAVIFFVSALHCINIKEMMKLFMFVKGMLLALWVFLLWFAHLVFDLGRGPITPPGPAMVLMDQKELNSKK